MDDVARLLFRELADLTPADREKLLADRQIAPELRAEVESLLSFDSENSSSLTDCVSATADEMLRSGDGLDLSHCGPYRLVRLLGSGGMGDVYLAERSDGEIQQKVAVKVLRAGANRPAWRDRFLKERQLLASLNHPSIARVMDAGHASESQPYLVMEYVDGVPIDVYAAKIDLRDKIALFLRVCDGVAHAHRHLIIHRDLKPSNILVDSSGQPKLLDFGIAKLLDETGDATQTVERLLTPNYASPEQLRGANQTTATDVYSLGAVLYKLMTGRSPHEADSPAGQAIPDPSRLSPDLPSDIDYILRKTLRYEPEERYASVEAFANDVRAFLEWRPVQARSGDVWYRTRRFLRRYWLPATAAMITIAGLSLGLYAANRQRAIAQRRFLQVRQLANKVLALNLSIRTLPGSLKARQEIVAMSKEYLEALRIEAHADQDLAVELGKAYVDLARAQGVPPQANLGQYAQADESLRRANALLDPVLAASPQNREALLNSAIVAHDRMILAEQDHRLEEALAQARKSTGRLDALLGLQNPSRFEMRAAAQLFSNMALAYKNMHLLDDSVRYARRSIDILRSVPNSQSDVGNALSVLADSLRFSGDLEGALQVIREARSTMEKADFTGETARRTSLFNVLWREGVILGQDGGINLNRPGDAIAALQRAFDLTEEWAQRDSNDASSRMFVGAAGQELAEILSHRDPRRAVTVSDHTLLRLREIKNNATARRREAQVLADSAYSLRRLNRIGEAKDRIDAAFRLLRETKDYPADRINPDNEAEAALRALGDHLGETGQPERAAEVYQELLDKIIAWKPDPLHDLRHAIELSRLYEALAGLYRRSGNRDRAEAMSAQRLELWRHWDRKLPSNSFIQRQLEAASLGS
jgi:serine/threonine protein kinase/tetratricopeptide (TPR) repeat protein